MKKIKVLLQKRKSVVLILFTIALIESVFFFVHYRHRFNIDCDSDFIFRAPQNAYEIKGVMILKLDYDKQGRISIDGIVKSKHGQTRLNRDALFTYNKINATTFKMDSLKIVKGERDTASDEDLAINFFSLAFETRRFLTIHRIENGYLVGNTTAPAFMCLTP
ncbi:hypothetical protein OWK27_01540 [Enterobacter cloacae complex sp. 2022EL-00788]|uniref:hypothetical protein n=1 Tax=Enterobacter cloacae complex sp. 2022EL-00788 TaxID=2996512 RepID=UPI002270EE58|nr:hypothetical protein [Enterobacter cloacae complex sp. 2022EL-00788]MCY0771401.1 hypothetical protein [Enterobacter cloacae complex sp. 2022EL-00788]